MNKHTYIYLQSYIHICIYISVYLYIVIYICIFVCVYTSWHRQVQYKDVLHDHAVVWLSRSLTFESSAQIELALVSVGSPQYRHLQGIHRNHPSHRAFVNNHGCDQPKKHMSRGQNQLLTPGTKNWVIAFLGGLSLYSVLFKSTLNSAKLQRNGFTDSFL